jgi:hypothetical protein
MMESNPHARGVDAAYPHNQTRHAFGVDDDRISVLFPVPFSEWVTLPERYRVTLAKRPQGR